MNIKFKDININNLTLFIYFFDDMTSIKNFDPNKINMCQYEKSDKCDMKSQTKIFLFITLDTPSSKILDSKNLIV